jgi:predicted nuclease of predicted toxin-antitoxin system
VKLLFDQNLSHRLCTVLADAFPGSEQVRRAGLDRATDDALIASFAGDGDTACLELY